MVSKNRRRGRWVRGRVNYVQKPEPGRLFIQGTENRRSEKWESN